MNYVCEIREKNEIPEPIHVIFNEVCRFSCINVLYLLSHHGNNLSEYQNHGPPTIYHLCCLVKKKSKENSAKKYFEPRTLNLFSTLQHSFAILSGLIASISDSWQFCLIDKET